MIINPIIGEQYWWKNNTQFRGKVVEVIALHHNMSRVSSFKYFVTVRIIESSYKGEVGLTSSTINTCLYDLATIVMEAL
jgi:hypothetical protein